MSPRSEGSPTSGPTCQAAECAGSWGAYSQDPTKVKGGITDGEESKGSEEEGGEEALTAVFAMKGGVTFRPLFYVRYGVVPSRMRTRRTMSHGWIWSTTPIPSTTFPNTV